MTWDFTPVQVMKDEVDYGFDDFRRDFFNQIKLNFNDERAFDLFWLVCHLSAMMKSPDEIKEIFLRSEFPSPGDLIEDIINANRDEIKMLIAIYQNLFLKYYKVALADSWGDDKKATDQAMALVNLYIHKHLAGGTPRKCSLPI